MVVGLRGRRVWRAMVVDCWAFAPDSVMVVPPRDRPSRRRRRVVRVRASCVRARGVAQWSVDLLKLRGGPGVVRHDVER